MNSLAELSLNVSSDIILGAITAFGALITGMVRGIGKRQDEFSTRLTRIECHMGLPPAKDGPPDDTGSFSPVQTPTVAADARAAAIRARAKA